MGKRLEVRYLGNSLYTAMKQIPTGTVFKATLILPAVAVDVVAFNIRGSALKKVSGNKTAFNAKQYSFSIGQFDTLDAFEVV